ncbi:hypothetical protein ZWY2020_042913 [Hordeum vulgare]|nr:hypothetical protein ZWY2020_042913 [Hordeum vulgare]
MAEAETRALGRMAEAIGSWTGAAAVAGGDRAGAGESCQIWASVGPQGDDKVEQIRAAMATAAAPTRAVRHQVDGGEVVGAELDAQHGQVRSPSFKTIF